MGIKGANGAVVEEISLNLLAVLPMIITPLTTATGERSCDERIWLQVVLPSLAA